MPRDPEKEDCGSIDVIRDILDFTATVDEAVDLLTSVNVVTDGLPIHYLIADAGGRSAIVEFGAGEVHVFPADDSWQAMTTFRLHEIPEADRLDECWRYATLREALAACEGHVSPEEGMFLLQSVAQPSPTGSMGTLWSAIYDLSGPVVHFAARSDFDRIHKYGLP